MCCRQSCNWSIFYWIAVSLVLDSGYGMHFADFSGTCSRFFIVCVSVWISTLCIDVKLFSHKSGSFPNPRDFYFCNLFSQNFTSFNLMSSHSCCSVSFFVLSSSLLIHSASSSFFFFFHIFFQNFVITIVLSLLLLLLP